jgi:phage N-6-adenine-methyltransferase
MTQGFEYQLLAAPIRDTIQASTREIHRLSRRAASDIIEIGTHLTAIKSALPHGQWLPWLRAEFGWGETTARRFMQIADRFQHANLDDLPIAPSALHILSDPGVSDDACTAAIERARAGERITIADAKAIVAEEREEREERVGLSFAIDDTPPPSFAWAPSGAQPVRDNRMPPDDEVIEGDVTDITPRTHARQVMTSSESNEWYTPGHLIEMVRAFYGGAIDLDPASSDVAQETVRAVHYYTSETDGLAHEWSGDVWLNPPYGDEVAAFVAKAIAEYEAGRVNQVILLVRASTGSRWFQQLIPYPLCFISGRLRFTHPDDEHTTSATFSSVLAYLGNNPDAFCAAFGEIGGVKR